MDSSITYRKTSDSTFIFRANETHFDSEIYFLVEPKLNHPYYFIYTHGSKKDTILPRKSIPAFARAYMVDGP